MGGREHYRGRAMDWFEASDDVLVHPRTDRGRWWQRAYGTETLKVSSQILFVTNQQGKLYEAVCERLDKHATAAQDHRERGYVRYEAGSQVLTVHRAPTPGPWAAQALEWLISSGARQILFINTAGSLRADVPVGSVILPGELVREEGTSYHYAAPNVVLKTSDRMNAQLSKAAEQLRVRLRSGSHWTTDAMYRETTGKVERLRRNGVNTVDMELSALAGVAHFRRCDLASLLIVTDVLTEPHNWDGVNSREFAQGVQVAAALATLVLLRQSGR